MKTITTFVDDGAERVDLNEEVIFKEDEADYGEEIDEDNGKDGRQQDGPAVLCHRPDDVQQRLLPVHNVQQLLEKHIISRCVTHSVKCVDECM